MHLTPRNPWCRGRESNPNGAGPGGMLSSPCHHQDGHSRGRVAAVSATLPDAGKGDSGSLEMSRMAGKPSWPSRKDLVRVSRGFTCGVSIGQAGWNLGKTRESEGAPGHLSCAEGQQATIGLERPGPAPRAPATCSMRSRPCIAGRARPCRTATWRSPSPWTTSTSTLTNLALPRIPEVPLRPGRDAWLPERTAERDSCPGPLGHPSRG